MLTIPSRATLRTHPVTTARTVLVPLDPKDAAEMCQAVDESRAQLHPWLPWVPYHTDEPSARRFAEACAADWDAGRAVRFVIREKNTRQVLGVVGLESFIHLHASCELGYWLRNSAQGFGYMTEAAGGLIHLAFQRMGVHRVRVAVATSNHRSLAVVARLGFRFEGIAREAEYCAGRWLDHAIFGLLVHDELHGG